MGCGGGRGDVGLESRVGGERGGFGGGDRGCAGGGEGAGTGAGERKWARVGCEEGEGWGQVGVVWGYELVDQGGWDGMGWGITGRLRNGLVLRCTIQRTIPSVKRN